MPTEQDILNLKLGKITPADFDLKFGAGSSQKYTAETQEEVPAVPEKESRLTEIPEQLAGAGIDTIKELPIESVSKKAPEEGKKPSKKKSWSKELPYLIRVTDLKTGEVKPIASEIIKY